MSGFALSRLVSKVRSTASTSRGVDAVFLFGSAARGKLHSGSDIDLAVLCAPPLSAARQEAVRARLQVLVEEKTGFECDVLNLRQAPTWLRYHVLKTGRCVYDRFSEETTRFMARSLLDFFDFQPVYERMERRLLERLKAA